MTYVSLFSGIEAASVAWRPLGWEPLCFAEIEPFPCKVLAARFPDVPNLGDVTKVDWSPYRGADVVVGGSPCQAFSIAGNRRGMDDERGRLMLEYVRAVRDIGPRWLVWENVPGVLSQDGGRAFATLLRELEDCGYCLAWRVLDAQFFGVAQRRRRVFVVGNTDLGRAAAVLLEPGCVPGSSGESRAKRASLARAAGERAGGEGGGCLNPWDVQSHRIYPPDAPSPSLCSAEKRDCLSPVVAFKHFMGDKAGGIGYGEDVSPTLTDSSAHQPAVAFPWTQGGNVNDARPVEELSPTIGAHPYNTPAVAFAQKTRDEVRLVNGDGQISGALAEQPGAKQQTYVAVSQYGDVAGALMARHDSSPCADRGQNIVCMTDTQPHSLIDTETCGALSATMHKDPPVVCDPDDWVVRRLTPLECERLMGFPDGWTDVDGARDGPRYKTIGNSMAVPVMRWLGERIAEVDALEV